MRDPGARPNAGTPGLSGAGAHESYRRRGLAAMPMRAPWFMQDPRALANTASLESYRAWVREGFRRSGLDMAALVVALSTPMFLFAALLIERAARGSPGALVRLMGTAMAVYFVVLGGLMLFGVLRMNAWRRAHPWSPPPPRAS